MTLPALLRHHILVPATVGVLASLFLARPSHATTITADGFATWLFGSYGVPGFPMGTVEVTAQGTLGNPDERLAITTHTGAINGVTVFGSALNPHFSTSAALSGGFTLSLDVLNGPGAFGDGQAIDFLVEQGGALYRTSLGVTGSTHSSWGTKTFLGGMFVPALFALAAGSGPSIPNFGGGVATRFGFAGGNSISNDLTMFYDNFKLEYVSATPVPEQPATLSLLALGLASLAGARWILSCKSA